MQDIVIIKGDSKEIDKVVSMINNNNNLEVIKNQDEAFGILKDKIDDPVKWQQNIRSEERDIYGELK